MAIIDFFDRGWRLNPKGVAYYMDGQEFTFTEIGELSCRIANALVDEGFKKETNGWSGYRPYRQIAIST
jgi:acyl-coenzyme A synthetase/AMP-(fatty) acid ligase